MASLSWVEHQVTPHQKVARPDRRGIHEEGGAVNDTDGRLQKLEEAVWKLGHDLNQAQRVIDLLLVNDPESEVRKHFVERAKKKLEHIDALRKAERKVAEMRFEIEDIFCQYPELREVYETRR